MILLRAAQSIHALFTWENVLIPPKAPGFALILMIQDVPRKESSVLNLETFQEMAFCAEGHLYVAPKPVHGEQMH